MLDGGALSFTDLENFHIAGLVHSSQDVCLPKTVFSVAVNVVSVLVVLFKMKREALLDPVTYKSKKYDLVYWPVRFF